MARPLWVVVVVNIYIFFYNEVTNNCTKMGHFVDLSLVRGEGWFVGGNEGGEGIICVISNFFF